MRTPLAISVAVGTLALAFAAQAIAEPPVQTSPGPDAVFISGDPITFTATSASTPPGTRIDFYVSRDPGQGPDGVLANWFDHIPGQSLGGDPPSYRGTPDQDEGWPKKPGTYYWQAAEVGCTPPQEPCESAPRSLTVNPLPASAVTSPQQIETYLDRHPRHRTRKRRVKFKFSSNIEGATFSCLFAAGWANCDSPHVFRRLKPGRYKFKVRAVVNDLKDPTPAKWVFRVLRRPDRND
jgi:hypothetical protein